MTQVLEASDTSPATIASPHQHVVTTRNQAASKPLHSTRAAVALVFEATHVSSKLKTCTSMSQFASNRIRRRRPSKYARPTIGEAAKDVELRV